MDLAGIHTEAYQGRFFWDGPAARSDQRNGPSLHDIIEKTKIPLQWDRLGSNYIAYPVGKANAGWRDDLADSGSDADEPSPLGSCARVPWRAALSGPEITVFTNCRYRFEMIRRP